MAAHEGDEESARALLERGARVNAGKPEGITPLLLAVDSENLGLVKLLLDSGADIKARRSDGYTALMDAAAAGNAEMVSLLLAHGAEVNARTAGGMTALSAAMRKPANDAVVRLLKDAGAK